MELERFKTPSTNETLKQIPSTYRHILFKYSPTPQNSVRKPDTLEKTQSNISQCCVLPSSVPIFFWFLLTTYSTASTTSCNVKAHSCNHCYHRKATSLKHYKSVTVSLP